MNNKLQKNLFRLGLPIFIELLFFNLLGAIDTLMLTRYNEDNVAAVGNANTVLNFLAILLNIVAVGISIVVSQYLGSKKEEEAKKALASGVLFNVSLGLIMFLVLQFFGSFLFRIINTPQDIFQTATSYLLIVCFAIPFQSMTCVLSANLRSNGKPMYIMITAIVANVINVILNYFLIYGYSFFPELGANGAAVATLVSNIFSCIVSVTVTLVVLKTPIITLKPHKESLRLIFKVGGPSALENVCYNTSMIIGLSATNMLLTNAVTARSYVFIIIGFIMQFSVAFGTANQIIVGYSVGEGNYPYARKATYKTFVYCIPFVILMVGLFNIFGRQLISILSSKEEVIQIALSVLPVVFLLEIGRCVNVIFINALKSSGDVMYPLICAIFSMFLVAGLGSWVFGIWLNLGLIGIFLAYALDELVRGILMLLRWKSGKWENKCLVRSQVQV